MTPAKQAQAARYKQRTQPPAPAAKAEVVKPDVQLGSEEAEPEPAVVPVPIPEAPAPVEPESDDPRVPSGAEEEEDVDDTADQEPGAAPAPKEYVVLSKAASYGPVIIGGKRVRTLKNKPYYVADVRERVAILGTGRFRAATKADLFTAGTPSAGPGGAITRDILPRGALKGGSVKP
jgi:hypothetical protein